MRVDLRLFRFATLWTALLDPQVPSVRTNVEAATQDSFQAASDPQVSTEINPPSIGLENNRELSPLIEIKGDVSDEFVQEVNEALKTIPKSVEKLLRSNGYKVILAPLLTDAVPDLRGKVPPGWPSGYTWENADATHNEAKKTVMVAEKQIDFNTKNIVRCSRVKQVTRHELGHAVSCLVLSGKSSCSYTKFRRLCNSDVEKMDSTLTVNEKNSLGYLLQKQDAGRCEAFAEIFAAVCGGGPMDKALVLKGFPQASDYLEKALISLE